MSKIALNLRIKGDFIDSFIYSGVLYVLDTNFHFTSYSWNDICNFILKRNGFKKIDANAVLNYAKDNRKFNNSIDNIDTDINEIELSTLKKDSINIEYWPSDINLFSNKLYYSGDDGVYYIQTDHLTAQFDKSNKINKIFGVKSFSISPNSHMRVALAAGNEGVFTSCSYFTPKNPREQQISRSSCIDIDWMNDLLFINSQEFVIKKFQNVISQNDINSDKQHEALKINLFNNFDENNKDQDNISKSIYRKYITQILNEKPTSLNLENTYKYGWSSGDCDFLIKGDNHLLIHNKISGNKKELNFDIDALTLLKVRTSGCGTIMEINDGSLYFLTENGSHKISNDFVSWRVYPRAKNHANHLHIINDDNINIQVYNNDTETSGLNTFYSKSKNDQYKYRLEDLLR
ncbi:hypothetical protein [Enterobacter hormaechei]|uniref:hypothetical protein n=1 Tax=Enterobacter hormaechei TaxID=158836 RepID=UPI001888709D|nr:hypothetical protein [Enterobacter hormaechei]MBF1981938.1 hypothetical protein [Enterobacter hormaechei]